MTPQETITPLAHPVRVRDGRSRAKEADGITAPESLGAGASSLVLRSVFHRADVLALHGSRGMVGLAGGCRRRLAHSQRRMDFESSRRAASGSLLVFEAGRSVVRVGMVERRPRRVAVPLGRIEGRRAGRGTRHRLVWHLTGAPHSAHRREPVRGDAGRAAGRRHSVHALSGAPAHLYAAAAVRMHVAGRNRSRRRGFSHRCFKQAHL